jgi:flagellar protein FlgJ
MDMSIDKTSLYSQYSAVTNNNSSALDAAKSINAKDSTDEELLDACKQFEQYFIRQVMKEMKNTIPKDSLIGDNEYMNMFEDQMLDAMAETISDNVKLGLAEQMYDNLRLQYNTSNIRRVDDAATTAEALSATAEAKASSAAVEAEEEETKVQAISEITNSVDI